MCLQDQGLVGPCLCLARPPYLSLFPLDFTRPPGLLVREACCFGARPGRRVQQRCAWMPCQPVPVLSSICSGPTPSPTPPPPPQLHSPTHTDTHTHFKPSKQNIVLDLDAIWISEQALTINPIISVPACRDPPSQPCLLARGTRKSYQKKNNRKETLQRRKRRLLHPFSSPSSQTACTLPHMYTHPPIHHYPTLT